MLKEDLIIQLIARDWEMVNMMFILGGICLLLAFKLHTYFASQELNEDKVISVSCVATVEHRHNTKTYHIYDIYDERKYIPCRKENLSAKT